MVLSLMLEKSGLGNRLAAIAVRHLGHSRWRLFIGLHLIGLGSAFLVPSGVVRVLLLMPIGIAIVDGLGERDSRSANAAILLSLLCSTYYGGCGILTGSVPNMMVAGQLELARGDTIYWSQWLRWMFPVIGLLRTGLCLAVVWYLFGRKMKPLRPPGAYRPRPAPALDPTQKKTLAILALGIGLWSTDSVHEIAPVFVGLALVAVCLVPTWGTLAIGQVREVNFPFFFYLAALFSIGSVLENAGVTGAVTDHLLQRLELAQYSWFGKHLALTAIVLPLNFLMDIAAVAGVVTPSMLQLGELHGVAHTPAAMSVAMATSLVFLPYQSAPFMVALTFRRFSLGQLALCMLLISALSFLLLCPLNVLYWRATGLI
jgi:di/tricarboxylate transporter